MVFLGYVLPKKNINIRLSDLKTAIKNSETLSLSNLYEQENTLALNIGNLTSSTSTVSTNTDPVAFKPTAVQTTFGQSVPVSSQSVPVAKKGAIDFSELKTKIDSPDRGLRKTPEGSPKKATQQNPLPKSSSPTSSQASTAESNFTADELVHVNSELADLQNVDSIEGFLQWFKKNDLLFNDEKTKRTHNAHIPFKNPSTKKGAKSWLGQSISGYNDSKKDILKSAFDTFNQDRSQYATRVLNDNTGSGLMGGRVYLSGNRVATGSYYNSYAPNFGNLFINHKSLKRNNLTISRPYSKKQLLSKRNMSQLLKKMIFDIANTLEFDSADYHNLQKDEKIIIEKIIRLQKDMKDVNINKLLEDDDRKIKKRIAILLGEVNAGNLSSLIKKELTDLLKKLYDNKAISYEKYHTSLKSINNTFVN